MMLLTVDSLWETSAETFAKNLPGEWLAISMTIVMIIAFFLVLLFMLSRLFAVRQLESTIKREMYQLGATVLLIMFLATFQNTSSFVIAGDHDVRTMVSEKAAEELLGKKGFSVNIFDVSYVYFVSITKCLKHDYTVQFHKQGLESITRIFLSLDVIGAQVPIPLSLIWLQTGVWKMFMEAMIIAEEIMWLSVATYFQINFLQWIETSMVTVYLPIGILLRSVPYTRGGGAAIMGIAISLYFVYPFLLAIMFFNGPQLPGRCSVEIEESPPAPPTSFAGKKLCPADPLAVDEFLKGDSGASGSGGDTSSSTPSMDVSGMGVVRMYSYFFPFVAMVGTVICARTLAQILGGNIADIGRGMTRVI